MTAWAYHNMGICKTTPWIMTSNNPFNAKNEPHKWYSVTTSVSFTTVSQVTTSVKAKVLVARCSTLPAVAPARKLVLEPFPLLPGWLANVLLSSWGKVETKHGKVGGKAAEFTRIHVCVDTVYICIYIYTQTYLYIYIYIHIYIHIYNMISILNTVSERLVRWLQKESVLTCS